MVEILCQRKIRILPVLFIKRRKPGFLYGGQKAFSIRTALLTGDIFLEGHGK